MISGILRARYEEKLGSAPGCCGNGLAADPANADIRGPFAVVPEATGGVLVLGGAIGAADAGLPGVVGLGRRG